MIARDVGHSYKLLSYNLETTGQKYKTPVVDSYRENSAGAFRTVVFFSHSNNILSIYLALNINPVELTFSQSDKLELNTDIYSEKLISFNRFLSLAYFSVVFVSSIVCSYILACVNTFSLGSSCRTDSLPYNNNSLINRLT